MQGHFTGVQKVFRVSLLKPHLPGGTSEEPPPPVEVEGEPQFEVEALLKHRTPGRGRQYLVRRLGYGPAHDEWIHEEELHHAAQLLNDYKEAHSLT